MSNELIAREQDGVRTLFDRTARALLAQGMVPSSPGKIVGGRPVLCAGAMLVREALALKETASDAEAFAFDVVERDAAFICEVGARAGLDAAVVRARIIENDRFATHDRLHAMVGQLRGLAEGE